MPSKPPILALDPATTTGWATWSGAEGQAVTSSGTWRIDDVDNRPGARLWRFYELLMERAREAQPATIAAEDAQFGSVNPDVKRFHAQLRGAIEMVAYRLNASVVFFKPTSIKAFAGNGRYKKPEMISAAKRHFGFVPRDDNEADALFVLAMARQGYKAKTKAKKKRAPRARRKEMLF